MDRANMEFQHRKAYRQQHKGYRDGLEQGRINLARELKHIIDKHLTIDLRADKKANKVSIKALEKFYTLLEVDTDNERC